MFMSQSQSKSRQFFEQEESLKKTTSGFSAGNNIPLLIQWLMLTSNLIKADYIHNSLSNNIFSFLFSMEVIQKCQSARCCDWMIPWIQKKPKEVQNSWDQETLLFNLR